MKTKIIILLMFLTLLYSCNNVTEEQKSDINLENKVLTEELESTNLWGGNWIPEEVKESRK